MDLSKRLAISYYKQIAVLNKEHQVYLVQHQSTNKIYVMKKMDIYNAAVYHTLQEHPIHGIPCIEELYEEDTVLTVIEEYITGDTLQERINAHALTSAEICCDILALCRILQELHGMQPPVIHRDIKPSNIIITPDHQLVLLDFNAAKYYRQGASEDTVLLGTKGYAAPEQYGFGASSPQTDIYAVGVLLREMAASLSVPDHQYDALISRCTQMDPTDRYASVQELQSQMQELSCFSKTGTARYAGMKPAYSAGIQPQDSGNSWLPPGFRTHQLWHMLTAIAGYVLIFYIAIAFPTENAQEDVKPVLKILVFGLLLSAAAVLGNYRQVQRLMPLCGSKNRLIRFLGTVLLLLLFWSALFVLAGVLVALFS